MNSATKIKFQARCNKSNKILVSSYKKDYDLSIDDYAKIISDLIYKSIKPKFLI